MLKNLTKIILTTLIVVSFVYVFNFVYKNKDHFNLQTLDLIGHKIETLVNKRDCGQVINYSLGSVNKSFNISNADFLKAIGEAQAIWEKGANRKLFNYSSTGALKINLVFDQRQQDTIKMKNVLSGITSDEDKLKAVKAEYDKLTAALRLKEDNFNSGWSAYQKSQAQFDALTQTYNAKVAAYEQQVAYWNAKGGAPKNEYDNLTQEKADIDAMYTQLTSEREALQSALLALNAQKNEFNGLVTQVNTIASIYNTLAEKLNVRVVDYNTTQGSKDEFVSGLYTSDASGTKIDIFQFYDHQDLVTTLAHELGHALGLGHAKGTSSIMYPRAEGQRIQLTKEDLQMLADTCR